MKACTRATSTTETSQTADRHSGRKRSRVSQTARSTLCDISCASSPAMTVQGKAVQLPGGSASYAAIDTGTTLVAGPASGIAAIYAQIPGSSPGTGQWEGYYSYRKFLHSLP